MTDPAFKNPQKRVDEDWKAQVEREKRQQAADARASTHVDAEREGEEAPAETGFSMFVSGIALQAFAALGEAPDPITGGRRTNLEQAKHLIDTLAMLEEKTKGNRTPDESEMLSALLYELRMKFVEKRGPAV